MSLPRYPEYKDSGFEWLGALPSHWDVRKFRHSFQESAERIDGEVIGPMLSVSGYRGIEIKDYDDENRRRTDEELQGYRIVRPGQLVVNTMWLNYAGLGVSPHEGHVSPAYRAYSISKELEPRFVHHMMRSGEFVKGYTKFLTGIRPNSLQMSRDDLMEFRLAEPPRGEQIAIADFLDHETAKIDALIAEQEKLLALLAEKRQATISHAVTRGLDSNVPMKNSGISWLGEVPVHWTVAMLRRFVARFEQGWSPECESRVPEAGEWGVLKAGCVNGGTFNALESKALPSSLQPRPDLEIKGGDVLMSRASGSPKLIGSVAYIEEAPPMLMLSDKIFRLGLSADVDPEFFALLMGSQPLRQQIEQAIGGAEGLANNLPQSSIKDFWICVPAVSEQRAIVECTKAELASLRVLAEAGQRTVHLLTERRSALIAAAVTGQIDVRGAVEPEAA